MNCQYSSDRLLAGETAPVVGNLGHFFRSNAKMKRCPPPPRRHLRVLPALCATLLTVGASARANTPDIDEFEELLLQNVRNGFIDYDGLAADDRFGHFIDQIGATIPGDGDKTDAGLAFYINAYNALAIQGIIDGRSPVTRGGRKRFFQRQKFRVLGENLSLDAIERKYLAASGDPRIYFAISCASMACPRLSSHAYRPETINLQLHDAARRFINDPTRNRFDLERRIAFLSTIFERHAEDFIQAGGSLQRYLARFVNDAEVQEALRAGEFELRFIEGDWGLNGYFSRAQN